MSDSDSSTSGVVETRTLSRPRGLLDFRPEWIHQLSRELPPEDLAPFVEHFWAVRWDLRGREPRLQETLPYPSVHLVFGTDGSKILGVVPGKFSVLLKDKGRVFGVKFRPGGFFPFYSASLSRLTGRAIAPDEVFGPEAGALQKAAGPAHSDTDEAGDLWFPKMTELASSLVRNHLPEVDPNIAEVNRIIDEIVSDHEITRVDHLIERSKLNKRALQRLFSRYVGVSPKWVIQRYRLHEALEQLTSGKTVDWARLALDLGYFDQAHFIKNFKMFVGKSPAEYARSITSAESTPG